MADKAVKKEVAKQNSGEYWVKWANKHAPGSNKIEKLKSPFKENFEAFKKALEDEKVGIVVTIISTHRPTKRCYLFHWAWKIALGKAKPSEAKEMEGVHIDWDHEDDAKSIAAAWEMVRGFGLSTTNKVAPSATSNHINGDAVDIGFYTSWEGEKEVKKKDGTIEKVKYLFNGTRKVKGKEIKYMKKLSENKELLAVAESYGLKHFGEKDEPHFSLSGG